MEGGMKALASVDLRPGDMAMLSGDALYIYGPDEPAPERAAHPGPYVYLPPSLYDEAERQGYDMRGYRKQPLMPELHRKPPVSA